MSKKHAYLIMAHNNFYCLEKLLMLLDDARNDIFLHIDAKVKNFDFAKFQSLCTRANVIYPEKRINVQWGTQSQVKTEMLLFKTALQWGEYHYFHLLSGADLPLKSQSYIHSFFEDKTQCYMTVHPNLSLYDYQRISRYHGLFGRNMPWSKRLNRYCAVIQDKFQVDRIRYLQGANIKRGWNWVSLPKCAVELLVDRAAYIRKMCRFSLCADEMYKQVLLLNAQQPNIKICEECPSMRLVDWERRSGSHPHTFTTKDYLMLQGSELLFARKFDENVDKEIIDKVFNLVMQQQLQEAKDENRNSYRL